MKKIRGGVTAPLGFRASGISCGIKRGDKKDLALIFSVVPCKAFGMFTTSRLQAAPVILSKERLKRFRAQAVIVNSGNANCCTGKKGYRDARSMAKAAARELHVEESDVLVASTGVIGKPLPLQKILSRVPDLVAALSRKGSAAAKLAIMTTDTRPKETAVKFALGRRTITVGGIAKGAGMIAPKMATMLCFITTDANISLGALKSAVRAAVRDSFNRITVDGDMSTNDSCIVLANRLAGNPRIDTRDRAFKLFYDALKRVMQELAMMIVKDGEGATKFVEVAVKHARSPGDAERVARKISSSNLVKAAVHGGDPNFGRIAAACGVSGASFDPRKLDIYLGRKKVLMNGAALGKSRKELREAFHEDPVRIVVDLNSGKGEARMWTCDLSEEYVKINARYS